MQLNQELRRIDRNMPGKRRYSDSSNEEEAEKKDEEGVQERQDLYVVFTSERDLRNVEQIRMKLSQFTGVVMRCKQITESAINNLLAAIEADAAIFQQQQSQKQNLPLKKVVNVKPIEMGGISDTAPQLLQTSVSGIVNLRFEECHFVSKAVQSIKNFLSQKQLIETFTLQKVEFQEPVADFRLLMEGLQFSIKIRKIGIMNQVFDQEAYGKILSHTLNDCRQLREFDCSGCEFVHPKCFFDMCQALIGEKCRLSIFKIKSINITQLEGKVLQFVLMKNKSLHTLDISNCKIESGECLEFFLQKLDKYSNIRYLVMDQILPDLSGSLEILGEALAENTKLEVLMMRENKLKWVPYANFWDNMKNNTSLQKINISKTDLSDRVLEKLSMYLLNQNLRLVDLDISRNQITDIGLSNLATALISNSQIKFLNLSQNMIRDAGIRTLVTYLSQPNCQLVELSLMGNKINNEGIHILSEFIKPNTSLKMLDISKNAYGDNAFINFAQEMGANATLTFLDISKSKELNDEGSLITLARQLAFNTHLQTLDLSGVRVRKPFLKLHVEPSLKKNITLKYVLGKLTPDIIDEQLLINQQIQTDVEPNFVKKPRPNKQCFDVSAFDADCNSRLDMKEQPVSLFDAAFKFIVQIDVRQVDLSGMGLQDGQIYQLAQYLARVPNLRSLILNGNGLLSDDGIGRLAASLSKNDKLAHLSFLNCQGLTNESLQQLMKVIQTDNMMLCSIEFDEKQFDADLGRLVKRESLLNKHIQEQLKPKFLQNIMSGKRPISAETHTESVAGDKKSASEEVGFAEGAQVNKYFTAAIKCWRISSPQTISIENQQLTDRHVAELCEFLKGRNQIVNLNLRRNKITNAGALTIIDWLLNHDTRLTHLDVSRNKITRAGATEFLAAIKKITRIIDLQITYGNPIPLDIALAINQEIVANNQIKVNQSEVGKMTFNTKVSISSCKYELVDRGPLFMRCAIKSVELLKITHLSLPDNMLGYEEAKMLAAMIKIDPPLRTLNLEQNNLDAQCAKLIGRALKENTNLQVLNVQKNALSDLGINFLLQSQIKSRLMRLKQSTQPSGQQATGAQNDDPSQLIAKQANQNKLQAEPKTADEFQESNRQLLTEEVQASERGQLKILNISENMCTLESYKVLWTLLQVNPSIVIYFDSPNQIRQHQRQQLEQSSKYQRLLEHSAVIDQSQVQNNDRDDDEEDPRDDDRGEEEDEKQSQVIVHQRSALMSKIIGVQARLTLRLSKIFSVLCCYNKKATLLMINKESDSLRVILTWKILQFKQSATEFKAIQQSLNGFDKPALQNTIQLFIVANQALLYVFACLPYVIELQVSGVILAIYIGYLLLFEMITLLIMKPSVRLQLCNPYLWIKILAGLLTKASILGVGLIGGIGVHKNGLQGGFIISFVNLAAIALDQYKLLLALKQCSNIDEDSVLPFVERSQKLSEICSYQGLVIALSKVTFVPSRQSEILSQKIAVDLNPDLKKAPAVGFIPKTIELINSCYHSSALARHLALIDGCLLSTLIITWVAGQSSFDTVTQVILAVVLLDGLSCLLQLTEQESVICLNKDVVFLMAQNRLNEKGERYNEVLMKEEEEPFATLIADGGQVDEESLFGHNEAGFSENDIELTKLKGADRNANQLKTAAEAIQQETETIAID